jgi:uncharacterized protein YdaU (DUF1376 family)
MTTKQKSPSYQWYPKDVISSARVAVLTLEEEGAYRRALDFCWLTGSLPADAKMLARIIGKGCTAKTATVVRGLFTRSKTNRSQLIHDRLEAERHKQSAWREKSVKGGLKSAAVRWGHEEHPADDTAPAIAAAAPPAVKNTKAIKSAKKTSVLLLSLHPAQVEEMLTGKYTDLDRKAIFKKLDEEFPAGYEFRDERHVFNAFKHTGNTILKALDKPAVKKVYDPMSRMRKLN